MVTIVLLTFIKINIYNTHSLSFIYLSGKAYVKYLLFKQIDYLAST